MLVLNMLRRQNNAFKQASPVLNMHHCNRLDFVSGKFLPLCHATALASFGILKRRSLFGGWLCCQTLWDHRHLKYYIPNILKHARPTGKSAGGKGDFFSFCGCLSMSPDEKRRGIDTKKRVIAAFFFLLVSLMSSHQSIEPGLIGQKKSKSLFSHNFAGKRIF